MLDAVVAVGGAGFALVLLVYAVEFACDVEAWRLTLGRGFPWRPWLARLYLVRLAGEAYNVVTPAAGMGGEPVKALLLKRRHGVPYLRSGASLVLAKTLNVVALVVFLAAGFALMLGDARISERLHLMAAAGLAALALGVLGFFLVQRLRVASRLSARFGPGRPRLARLAAAIAEFDGRLVEFYTRDPLRCARALALGFANWTLGAAGVWVTLAFMGAPLSFTDAWIVEAMAQMVRAATFFIPASLGAQDAVIMLVMAAVSGSAEQGLAVALVRRGRELVWVLAGLGVSAPLLGARARRGADGER